MKRLLPTRRRPWLVTSDAFFPWKKSANSCRSTFLPMNAFMTLWCLKWWKFFGHEIHIMRFPCQFWWVENVGSVSHGCGIHALGQIDSAGLA
jgi:hypothetical protein